MKVPEPHGQLQYTDTGLEYVVRYPVGLHQVAEADEKITRKLLELLQQHPICKRVFRASPGFAPR